MSLVVARCFAKVNLGLRVIGRRPDGYHDLVTTLQSIDLHDDLRLEAADRISLEVEGEIEVPAGESNLVMRAARALEGIAPGRGARIVLHKRIPAGSGLGGGSSNAAVTLMGLDRLWGTGLAREALGRIAGDLGADVPFFLHGGTCLAVGRGDEPLPLPDIPTRGVLVVWPGVVLPTREVYRALPESLTRGRNLSSMRRFTPDPTPAPGRSEARGDPGGARPVPTPIPDLGNDLEEAAAARIPGLGQIRRLLIASGADAAAMSGSGSAVYGLFTGSPPDPAGIGERFGAGARIYSCSTLTRDAYRLNLFERSKDGT